ncbi:GntR family transcriptional regulator [Mycobacterium sp. pW049]|uniref:GntR family transcriptional regulator n=1 Tax=[Mycobacterium] bulgaricum TaxID=3238985 RepID=UPI00351AD132
MTSVLPTYLVLADKLAEQISELEPRERLPSEVELAERHHVSRLTARAAMQELERRYLVRRAKGSGTYVAERVEYVISPRFVPWTDMVHQAGATTTRPILRATPIRANDDISQSLGLARNSRVVELVRLGTVNEVVANLTHSYLPTDLAPQFPELLATAGTDLVPVLRSLGYRPKRLWAYAELAVPDIETAKTLEVDGRPPLWLVVHCIVDATSGRRLVLSRAWNRPDVLRVRFEFGSPDVPSPSTTPAKASQPPRKDTE